MKKCVLFTFSLKPADFFISGCRRYNFLVNYSSLVTILNEGSLSAFGGNSRYGMIYEKFGFTPIGSSIESSIHGQSISYEYVLYEDPDLLFVGDRTLAVGGDHSDLSENSVNQETKAYQNDILSI